MAGEAILTGGFMVLRRELDMDWRCNGAVLSLLF